LFKYVILSRNQTRNLRCLIRDLIKEYDKSIKLAYNPVNIAILRSYDTRPKLATGKLLLAAVLLRTNRRRLQWCQHALYIKPQRNAARVVPRTVGYLSFSRFLNIRRNRTDIAAATSTSASDRLSVQRRNIWVSYSLVTFARMLCGA